MSFKVGDLVVVRKNDANNHEDTSLKKYDGAKCVIKEIIARGSIVCSSGYFFEATMDLALLSVNDIVIYVPLNNISHL